MLQNLFQKCLAPICFWRPEKYVWRGHLDDFTAVHKHHFIGHSTRKTHLVCDTDHRHPAFGKPNHNIKNFRDHFWIQGGSWLIKQQNFGFHAQGPRNGHALLLTAR